jgi:hypothetical protein
MRRILMAYHTAVLTIRAALTSWTAGNPRVEAIPVASGAAITPPAETALVDSP